jgi:ferredoxin--NADP+ reductase
MGRFVAGEVVGQKEWSPTLRSLFINAPVDPFVAGQFTQLAVEDPTHLFRPYSFVNAPSQPTLEFYYSILTGGNLTPQLADLAPGNAVWVAKRPSGRFILSSLQDASVLWLFATGTGLGVFLAMLQTKEPWERFQKIVLVHSVQQASGLTHSDLIEVWQNQYHSQFHWIPTVTGDKKAPRSQRMTELLRSGELESMVGVPLAAQTSQTMLCGNPAMVNDLSQLLLLRGLKINHLHQPGHITVENYWKLDKQRT